MSQDEGHVESVIGPGPRTFEYNRAKCLWWVVFCVGVLCLLAGSFVTKPDEADSNSWIVLAIVIGIALLFLFMFGAAIVSYWKGLRHIGAALRFQEDGLIDIRTDIGTPWWAIRKVTVQGFTLNGVPLTSWLELRLEDKEGQTFVRCIETLGLRESPNVIADLILEYCRKSVEAGQAAPDERQSGQASSTEPQ